MPVLIGLVALIVMILVVGIGILGLTEELGWIGFYTGVFTFLSLVAEGDFGPLTRIVAGGGVLASFAYMVYEWYSTTPIFF